MKGRHRGTSAASNHATRGRSRSQLARKYLPILDWGRHYDARTLGSDALAALIVTIMLIPQSLAYALLAGLPPEAGIYASILPLVLYAIFGTSRSLSVGPVAVVSLLTATAVGQVARQGTADYATAALTLAALSGGILVILGVLRLGLLANFLSHPVIAGFVTASGILIAASQLRHILGVEAGGHTLIEIAGALWSDAGRIDPATVAIGVPATAFLFWVRRGMKAALVARGVPARVADMLTKVGPVLAIVASTVAVRALSLDAAGVSVVGSVPQGLPPFTLPGLSPDLIGQLLVPALLISIVGFVESISVARTLAAKKRGRIDPDQELIGLGAANLGAAFTGGYPVTGGFSRSVVNDDAGAETPAAGAFTALGLALAAAFLTPLIAFLPNATLAATIIVAVTGLVDLSILRRTWAYSTNDFAAVALTIVVTLGAGVEIGVATGVVVSLVLHLVKTSKPHVAIVGLVPGTHHFRNVDRHRVETDPALLTIRVDESLYFANASFLETLIQDRVARAPQLAHVILMCSAVNEIDFSALESLEAVNARLCELGIGFHLSEVKGPVMDRLETTHFLDALNGDVHLSQYDAWSALRAAAHRPAGEP